MRVARAALRVSMTGAFATLDKTIVLTMMPFLRDG